MSIKSNLRRKQKTKARKRRNAKDARQPVTDQASPYPNPAKGAASLMVHPDGTFVLAGSRQPDETDDEWNERVLEILSVGR